MMIDNYKIMSENSDYTHFVVEFSRDDGVKIVSGWEYPEDAIEALPDESEGIFKMYSRRLCARKGLNPANPESWG